MHRNIRIENNEFVLRGTTAVKAKSTTGLRVTGNTILAKGELDDARSIQTTIAPMSSMRRMFTFRR